MIVCCYSFLLIYSASISFAAFSPFRKPKLDASLIPHPQFPFKILSHGSSLSNSTECNNAQINREKLPFCVSPQQNGPSYVNQHVCDLEDSCCGDWNIKSREFRMSNCNYRDVTPEQGRKCFDHRTMACIGDSQIRDLCWALNLFLNGTTVLQAPNSKYDRISDQHATIIKAYHFPSNQTAGTHIGGFLLPIRGETNATYELRVTFLHNIQFYRTHERIRDLLQNRVNFAETMSYVNITFKPLDFALINWGLHESSQWRETTRSYGEQYCDFAMKPWLSVLNESSVPTAWMSLNAPCLQHSLDNPKHFEHHYFNIERLGQQANQVEATNTYIHAKCQHEKIPYFDAAAVGRNHKRCQLGNDQTHYKQWVAMTQAKMLLNHLCDEDWNWIGTSDRFVL